MPATAELVIAGAETRRTYPAADAFPLHFRKTYFPGRLHGDPQLEYERHLRASELCATPPPIGYASNGFRSCLVPGQSYARLTLLRWRAAREQHRQGNKAPLATAAWDSGGWPRSTRSSCCCCTRAGLRTETPSCTTSSKPCAARANPHRLRGGGAAGNQGGGRSLGSAVRAGSPAAAARSRRLAVPARPAVGAAWESSRGGGWLSCSSRRIDFGAPSTSVPRSDRFSICSPILRIASSGDRLVEKERARNRGRNAGDPNSWSIVPSG